MVVYIFAPERIILNGNREAIFLKLHNKEVPFAWIPRFFSPDSVKAAQKFGIEDKGDLRTGAVGNKKRTIFKNTRDSVGFLNPL